MKRGCCRGSHGCRRWRPVVTIGLKTGAWALTGSVGLLSDAMESFVNLAGAILALAMITVAARPEDEAHPYGHSKAEYFSSGVEGVLILIAAVGIALTAVQRLLAPRPLEQVGLGLVVSVLAALVNLGVALVLLRAARRHHSVSLEANAHHLLTDVWTSVGVLVGVGATTLTHLLWLDPLVAIAVSANIVWTAIGILRRSVLGLMDTALSKDDQERLNQALAPHIVAPVQIHALRSRQAGARRFVSMHVLVPGEWTVHRGHALLEVIEADIRRAIPNVTVMTHLESLDDPASWDDVSLDRPTPEA
jgi:cation diffusion facilitator family transporter